MILQKKYNYENLNQMLKNPESYQDELFNYYTQPQIDFSTFINDYIFASQYKDSKLYQRLKKLSSQKFTVMNLRPELSEYFGTRPENTKQLKEMLNALSDDFNNQQIKDLINNMVENIENTDEIKNYVYTIIENLPLEEIEKVNKIENEIEYKPNVKYIDDMIKKYNVNRNFNNIMVGLSILILGGVSGLALFIYLLVKK